MTIAEERKGLLFVLVGPGGGGKNALMRMIIERLDDIKQLPTATTRAIRSGETQGVEHDFISVEAFQKMIANEELIEWQEVHPGRFYGVPKRTVEKAILAGQDRIADIEVLGATILRQRYPDNTVLIFINVPGDTVEDQLAILRERMEVRGEPEEEIQKRLRRTRMELPYAATCDYLIINDDMDAAAEELYSIIKAERCRRRLVNHRAHMGMPRHRLAYLAQAIPVYGEEVLLCDHAPIYPQVILAQGELPNEAAQRAIQQYYGDAFEGYIHGTTANRDFITPVGIATQQTAFAHYFTFYYIYRLDHYIPNPPKGRWLPLAEAPLPDIIALEQLADLIKR